MLNFLKISQEHTNDGEHEAKNGNKRAAQEFLIPKLVERNDIQIELL